MLRRITLIIFIIWICLSGCVAGVAVDKKQNTDTIEDFSYTFTTYLTGDTDSNGIINIRDCTMIQCLLVNLKTPVVINKEAIDVNCDGKTNIEDVTQIQRHLVGFSVESEIGAVRTNAQQDSRIYGVVFNVKEDSTSCTRIAYGENLSNDYVVSGKFQGDGKNDFDSIFPWSDIRRCNLTVDSQGRKTVIYESDEDFATDGSMGDVMVEIPKFYTFRHRVGDYETWAISGEPVTGFSVEPAFVDNDGEELDYIYVGAYEFSGRYETKAHSLPEKFVQNSLCLDSFRNIAKESNMGCMDYATLHAIQFLYVVEFADRDTDKYMQGFSEQVWFSSGNVPIKTISADKTTVTIAPGGERSDKFRVGQNVLICRDNMKIMENLTIKNIKRNSNNTLSIMFEKPINKSLINLKNGTYYVAGQPQSTGRTDTIGYHTGRENHENSLSTFRYRYMENIWGNSWTMIDGLRVKELEYYYTFDTDNYDDDTVEDWTKSGIKAPNQPYLGDDGNNRAWIAQLAYSAHDKLTILPVACSSFSGADKNYSSALYTHYDKDKYGNPLNPKEEYLCLFGGGYDHNTLCGVFTMRFWFAEGMEESTLHSTRVVYRE